MTRSKAEDESRVRFIGAHPELTEEQHRLADSTFRLGGGAALKKLIAQWVSRDGFTYQYVDALREGDVHSGLHLYWDRVCYGPLSYVVPDDALVW